VPRVKINQQSLIKCDKVLTYSSCYSFFPKSREKPGKLDLGVVQRLDKEIPRVGGLVDFPLVDIQALLVQLVQDLVAVLIALTNFIPYKLFRREAYQH
jgi:hypothetical protein